MSKKRLEEDYDKSAGFYDSRYKKIQEEKYKIMSEFFPKKHTLALDLGCGTGMLSKEISNLVGIDISLNVLKIARERGEITVQGESENLPFKDNTFSVVFSFTALQGSNNLKKSIEEIKRVLKKDGTLLLTFLRKKFNSDVVLTFENNFEKVKKIPCGEDIGFVCS